MHKSSKCDIIKYITLFGGTDGVTLSRLECSRLGFGKARVPNDSPPHPKRKAGDPGAFVNASCDLIILGVEELRGRCVWSTEATHTYIHTYIHVYARTHTCTHMHTSCTYTHTNSRRGINTCAWIDR